MFEYSAHPKVTVIILNYNGLRFLPRCLETLHQTNYTPLDIVVVDNNSSDQSLSFLRKDYPDVKIISFKDNLGYAGAYNESIAQIDSKYVVLLNFDVEVEPEWLTQAIDLLETQPTLAAVQPKLRSLQNRKLFEYSGGSGGFIDRYGYPFVRGRIFDTLEEDHGAYADIVPIFWATGAAFITRRSAFLEAGGLDHDFFLHMEELDLCWRFWLLGYEVKVAPQGVVYHYAGAALSADRYYKMYFNHRNSLAMLIKNYSLKSLWRCLPVRWILDLITLFTSLVKQPKRAGAIIAAHTYILVHLPALWRKRRRVQRMRKINDRDLQHIIFPYSIVWRYFIKQQKTFRQLTAVQ